jgi:hypothetical protein
MPRRPIKKHQRGVSLFVLQWLVLRALRYVQWNLSSKRCTKVHPHLDSLSRKYFRRKIRISEDRGRRILHLDSKSKNLWMKQALEHHILAGHESDWTLRAIARAPRPEPADSFLNAKREEQPSARSVFSITAAGA